MITKKPKSSEEENKVKKLPLKFFGGDDESIHSSDSGADSVTQRRRSTKHAHLAGLPTHLHSKCRLRSSICQSCQHTCTLRLPSWSIKRWHRGFRSQVSSSAASLRRAKLNLQKPGGFGVSPYVALVSMVCLPVANGRIGTCVTSDCFFSARRP